MMRDVPERTRVMTEDAINALVPCVSKCCDQSGIHHGFVMCCLLKTSSVCADVPTMTILNTTTRPVMMV
jgi:hypothetical protein